MAEDLPFSCNVRLVYIPIQVIKKNSERTKTTKEFGVKERRARKKADRKNEEARKTHCFGSKKRVKGLSGNRYGVR